MTTDVRLVTYCIIRDSAPRELPTSVMAKGIPFVSCVYHAVLVSGTSSARGILAIDSLDSGALLS